MRRPHHRRAAGLAAAILALAATASPVVGAPRARDLGLEFPGTPGPLNAVTDVPGVRVGHVTVLRDGPPTVRSGVTAILPSPAPFAPLFAGVAVFNGNGELTGAHWIREGGYLEGPILLTGTYAVGRVADGALAWTTSSGWLAPGLEGLAGILPVVGETWDGRLSDPAGGRPDGADARAALDAALARPDAAPVAEGSVGGGTGMVAFGWKAGIGTASRVVEVAGASRTVGVLVQANFGRRPQLVLAGRALGDLEPDAAPPDRPSGGESGSLVAVILTDAPLLPHQLERLARRGILGMARTGGLGGNGSGDLFLAVSTAQPDAGRAAYAEAAEVAVRFVPNELLDPLLAAAALAVEEAIANALVAGADGLTGRDGRRVPGLPLETIRR